MNNPGRYLDRLFAGRCGLRRSAFIAALLSVAGTASAQYAGFVGANFVDNSDSGIQNSASDALGSAEVAGAPGFAQSNWNNLGRWGDPTTLNDNTGAATSLSVSWDSNNTWQNGADMGTPDGKLMYGYLDSNGDGSGNNIDGPPYNGFDNANKPDAMVTGISAWLGSLGAASYSVLVYFDGDATEGRTGEYWLQSFTGSALGDLTLGSDLTAHVFANDSDNFAGAYTQVPLSANSVDNAASGNFLVFDNLTSDSFLLRTEERSFHGAFINGFQVVAVVPEPGALSLLGLGALGLAFARRRHA